ncbi:MAG: GH25 family lysozyme [Eubacteriales bacterium]
MKNRLNHTFKKTAVLVLSAMLFLVSIPVSAATDSQSETLTSTSSSSSSADDTGSTDASTNSDTSSTDSSTGGSSVSSDTSAADDTSLTDTSTDSGSVSSDTTAADGTSSTDTSTDGSSVSSDTSAADDTSSTDTSTDTSTDSDSSTSDSSSEEVSSTSSSSDETTTGDGDPLLYRDAEDFEDSSSSTSVQLFSVSATSTSSSSTPTLPSKYEDYNVSQGIDVSKFQGDIDWEAVKEDGIDFAIIRIGYTTYGSGTICEDPMGLTNLKEAKAAGLEVGAYYFSQAITTDEAVEEAEESLALLEESGVTLDHPMFIDYEYISDSDGAGRLQAAKDDGLSESTMTSIVETFCATVSAGGYKAGVYASKSMLTDDLDYSDIQDSYTVWLAHWTTSATDYAGDFSFWQYSESGSVDGIDGSVDMDIHLTKDVSASATVDATAYVQKTGWMSTVSDGETVGTTGKSLRLEAFKLEIDSSNYTDSSISYTSYVEGSGWQSYVSDGATSGTTGQSKRIEAVKIKLSGDIASDYDVWYRVHVQHIGWMSWTSNDSIAGTTEMDYRIEAIQVVLVTKGDGAPANSGAATTLSYLTNPGVSYQTYVQKNGWMSAVENGATSGTRGQSLRVEAIKINASASGLSIAYKSHLQNTGWESSWTTSGGTSGTMGESRRLEAIQIKLTGAAASYLDVYYRVYVQKFGWLAWAKNGATAGTTGYNLRVEAIQIVIRSKTDDAPSNSGSSLSVASLTA